MMNVVEKRQSGSASLGATVAAAMLFVWPLARAAEEVPCSSVIKMVQLVHARPSEAAAIVAGTEASDYRTKLAAAAIQLELQPQSENAGRTLLELLPKSDEQQADLMTLGDQLCASESMVDMKILGKLRDRIPRDFARAASLVPSKLPEYVRYSFLAVQDPHSDFVLQMESVCEQRRSDFLSAVQSLPKQDQDWFEGHIFDTNCCRALLKPESVLD
jgi:hypothetical protein